MAVVPLPKKGSSTRSPSWVEANRQRSTSATGFCVGCLPKVFSSPPGAGMVQMDSSPAATFPGGTRSPAFPSLVWDGVEPVPPKSRQTVFICLPVTAFMAA